MSPHPPEDNSFVSDRIRNQRTHRSPGLLLPEEQERGATRLLPSPNELQRVGGADQGDEECQSGHEAREAGGLQLNGVRGRKVRARQ